MLSDVQPLFSSYRNVGKLLHFEYLLIGNAELGNAQDLPYSGHMTIKSYLVGTDDYGLELIPGFLLPYWFETVEIIQ